MFRESGWPGVSVFVAQSGYLSRPTVSALLDHLSYITPWLIVMDLRVSRPVVVFNALLVASIYHATNSPSTHRTIPTCTTTTTTATVTTEELLILTGIQEGTGRF